MKFELTNNELSIVLTALNEMPHRLVAELINKLITEARAQEGEQDAKLQD